jgi:hypothetical protein
LAVVAGCQGVHAIAQFAKSLTHPQRRWLRCRPRPGHPREYEVPSERTFRRLLKRVDPDGMTEFFHLLIRNEVGNEEERRPFA